MLLVLLAVLAAPRVTLDAIDARGCGAVSVNGQRVAGAAPGLCVKQALWTPLEGGLVALLVAAPHRFEPRVRHRVFLYRLDGARLVPRFLGSGFRELEVEKLVPLDDALGLSVTGAQGTATLRCRFTGFPLTCQEEP